MGSAKLGPDGQKRMPPAGMRGHFPRHVMMDATGLRGGRGHGAICLRCADPGVEPLVPLTPITNKIVPLDGRYAASPGFFAVELPARCVEPLFSPEPGSASVL
jgi:hypothetical protein